MKFEKLKTERKTFTKSHWSSEKHGIMPKNLLKFISSFLCPPPPLPITSTNRQNLLRIKGILKFKTQHFTDSVSWSVSKKSRLTIISAQATEFILVELGFLRSLGNILVLCSDCRNMSTIMPLNACLITEYRLAWLGELPQSTWPPVRGLCSGIVWNLGQELRAITYVSYTVMVLS